VSDTSTTLIPVRVTRTSTDESPDGELLTRIAVGGLTVKDGAYFATQGELDTPHTTFRLSPR
jgi:hypothetical protein